MEPHVRYAHTEDGVSIAYASTGSGPPMVLLPTVPFSFFQLEWEIPEYRRVFEALAQRMQLVQYDARGNGHSQREVSDVSLAAMLRDLDAVVEHAQLDRFALFGLFSGCPIALAYAASHPDRVSHLLLWAAFAQGSIALGDPQAQALLSLIERDWTLFSESAASAWMGWFPTEAARRVAHAFRSAVTPEVARQMLDTAMQMDVTQLLTSISAPTMVLHRAGMTLDMAGPRAVVAGIGGAYLEVLPGDSPSPYIGDTAGVVRQVLRFCLNDSRVDIARQALPAPSPTDGLTRRELDVLRGLASGDTNQQIAAALGLSVHTVERHVANIYRKIDARGRADATVYALHHGLA